MSHCESCMLQSQCFLNNLGSIFVNSFFQFFGLRDWPHLIRLPTGMGVNLTLRWIKLSEELYFLQVVSWCQMATYMTGSWRWFLPDYHFLDGGHALLDLVRVIFLFSFLFSKIHVILFSNSLGDLVCTLKMKYAILFLEIYTPLTILLSAYIDVMRDSKETCFLS